MRLLTDTWISLAADHTFVFTDGEDEELNRKLGGHLVQTNCSSAHSRQALSCKMAVELDTFMRSQHKWFCHVDDDNYVNPRALVRLLSRFSHRGDSYLGRASLDHPIRATGRAGDSVRFWFATGGAGFCLSRGLALKMAPWTSDGAFMETAERIRLPDDCTVGFVIEWLLGVPLTRSPLFHSHLEGLAQIPSHALTRQVTLSYGTLNGRSNVVSLRGGLPLDEDPTRFKSVHCTMYPDTPWCPTSSTTTSKVVTSNL